MLNLQTIQEKLGRLDYSVTEIDSLAGEIAAVKKLAQEKDAIILAHNYQRPEILLAANFIGDSLELAKRATTVSHTRILFAGVHFMAETAKILNPDKIVLLPNRAAGCSLADTADEDDVRDRIEELRRDYPNLGVVAYVNTTAAVKALADICCTSSNAVRVVESLDRDPILFLPDRNLAAYVAESTTKKIIPWNGNCYVHQQIRPEEIERYKRLDPELAILVHPECRKDVQAIADAVASTSRMIEIARESPKLKFLVVTECGLTDRLEMEVPEKKFFRGCKLCAFMKVNTLPDVHRALMRDEHQITLHPEVAANARRALERMIAV